MDMHKKTLPVTLLVSGLLAAPGLGAVPVRVEATRAPIVEVSGGAAFPAAMPEEVLRRYRRWAKGEKPDVGGMRVVQERIAAEMQDFLMAAGAGPAVRPGTRMFEVLAAAPAGHRVTFLGVATISVPRALATQLHLPEGMGLVVEQVAKESPAATAGLAVDDVLQKFDDQLLVNSEQFRTLVRSKKPGDKVTLTLIRGGKEMTVSVTLADEAVAEGDVQEVPLPGPGEKLPPLNMDKVSISRDDGAYAISLSIANGQRHLVVKNEVTGKTLYDGPADTQAQWNDLPEDVKTRIAAVLEKVNTLRKEN